MRNKLLAKNTVASLIAQITTLICGFILPRLFLQHFGSEVNGLVNSIVQFLSVISFLELGVGAVVESSLYKPLAEKDNQQISKVMVSANKFFSAIGADPFYLCFDFDASLSINRKSKSWFFVYCHTDCCNFN